MWYILESVESLISKGNLVIRCNYDRLIFEKEALPVYVKIVEIIDNNEDPRSKYASGMVGRIKDFLDKIEGKFTKEIVGKGNPLDLLRINLSKDYKIMSENYKLMLQEQVTQAQAS